MIFYFCPPAVVSPPDEIKDGQLSCYFLLHVEAISFLYVTTVGCNFSLDTGSSPPPPKPSLFFRSSRSSIIHLAAAAPNQKGATAVEIILAQHASVPKCTSGNPGCSVPSPSHPHLLSPPHPPLHPSLTCCHPPNPRLPSSNSQRRLVHVDHLVVVQRRVRPWLAEEESELHQSHATERRHVLRGAERPEKCLRGHLSR